MTTLYGRSPRVRVALACVAAVSGLGILRSEVEARPRGEPYGAVVACSHFGKGCIQGAVRRGPAGLEVRMPGGTWIGCKWSCRRTLREEALDLFETLNERVWDR